MKPWHAIVAILAVPLLAAQDEFYRGPSSRSSMDSPQPVMTMPFVRLHSKPIPVAIYAVNR